MAELRWVLLALGVLVVAGIYVWSRGLSKRNAARRRAERVREEPRISLEADLLSRPSNLADEPYSAPEDELIEEQGFVEAAAPPIPTPSSSPAHSRLQAQAQAQAQAPSPSPSQAQSSVKKTYSKHAPDKVVTIRFVPKHHMIDGHMAVRALREAGLEHGRYGIFHKHKGGNVGPDDDVLFSVASLTEPGSFDLDNLGSIAGMSFFIALPNDADPVECFDAMVETARSLSHRLDSDLLDDRGSSWSIQRERYVREELIRYRHQHYVH